MTRSTKFKAEDWVRNTDLGGTLGVFTRYVKPHGGLPMCEVRVGNVIHICREYLLRVGKGQYDLLAQRDDGG